MCKKPKQKKLNKVLTVTADVQTETEGPVFLVTETPRNLQTNRTNDEEKLCSLRQSVNGRQSMDKHSFLER